MSVKGLTESGTPLLSLLSKLKSAPPASASASAAGPSEAKPVADKVSLSAQATAALTGAAGQPAGNPPLVLAGGPSIDFQKDRALHDKVIDYFGKVRDHRRESMKSIRAQFGLDADIDKGGGLALSGKIGEVIDRHMAANGRPLPEKPPEVLEWENRSASPQPPQASGWGDTSMITLFLPGSQGTGSKQIDILLDNRAMEKLASLSADEVKGGLVDMLNGPDAAAAKAAVDNGSFGAAMRVDAERHPEWQASKARVGFFDPQQGTKAQPWLMIQSETETDYVRENAGKLVDAVMTILKDGAAGRAAG